MGDALQALGIRLRYLTDIISARDELPGSLTIQQKKSLNEAKAAERNFALDKFKTDALSTAHDPKQDESPKKTYTTRLFSYIHAEFNFNSPRYLSRCARITHLVFTPLYVERTLRPRREARASLFRWARRLRYPSAQHQEPLDNAKSIGPRTQETLEWLWSEAIYDSDPAVEAIRESFRGGKDRIFEFIKELFDFSEPYITTKRSIWEAKKKLMARLGERDPAALATREIEDDIRNAGLSSRLTNTVEYFWKFSRLEKVHFKWTRHARPYQTYTLTHETVEPYPDSEDPFGKIALQAFPGEIFDGLFGRFVQGANYIIVPVEAFLSSPEVLPGSLEQFVSRETIDKIARTLDTARLKNHGRDLDELVVSKTKQFLHRAFKENIPGEFRNEFVGLKCMDGQAYVFASIRNGYTNPNGEIETLQNLFTRTVIVDCGMNGFQRARLIQNLTEFATERTLALLWIARFRLIHNALNVISARLSLAVSNYHNGDDQRGSVVLPSYFDDLTKHGSGAAPERQRQLIIALEFLSSCLTILNDVIEGGIADRASAVMSAYWAVEGKTKSIREQAIQGHQTLTDFLHRRFIPAARMIGRTGERYTRLRERIAEIAELSNAHLQAEQRDEHRDQAQEQTKLLRVAEYFGEAALGYYGAHLISDWLSDLCDPKAKDHIVWLADHVCRHAGAPYPPISTAAVYTVALAVALVLMGTSTARIFRHDFKERRERARK